MAWLPDIEILKAYISVMTDEQYDKFENIILGTKEASCFTMSEVRDLENKLTAKREFDHNIKKTAELNNAGILAEQMGDLEKACQLYEQNILIGRPATHFYERLMVLYRKQKRYADEIRIIDKAIEVFTAENERRFQVAISQPENRDYLLDIQAAMETSTGVKNKDGWYIFSPYPLMKYISRKEKAIKLISRQQ